MRDYIRDLKSECRQLASQLNEKEYKMQNWRHEYTVTGCGAFPVDMLRYDASYPKSTDDAVSIALNMTDDKEVYLAMRTITLCHVCDFRSWSPTEGQWDSFVWTVADHKAWRAA
jgi:hypothetical protein